MKNKLSHHVQEFFQNHLVSERGLSKHTVLSYRDTMKLYLSYLSASLKKKIEKISLNDLTAKSTSSFLSTMEKSRGNSIRTRNQRLAVLKAFFSYLMQVDPERMSQYERIYHLKSKKNEYRPIEYLEKKEVEALLIAPDQQTDKGFRDYVLLLFLYNSGARVSELCDLRAKDVFFESPSSAMLKGKGNKYRRIPLWENTSQELLKLFEKQSLIEDEHLFRNKSGERMSRFGVLYIIKKYVEKASKVEKGLKDKKITPHTFRHTTAMHLLQSGVDITVIKAWLGHVDLNTTHSYVEINMEMKRKALSKSKASVNGASFKKLADKNENIISWLESF